MWLQSGMWRTTRLAKMRFSITTSKTAEVTLFKSRHKTSSLSHWSHSCTSSLSGPGTWTRRPPTNSPDRSSEPKSIISLKMKVQLTTWLRLSSRSQADTKWWFSLVSWRRYDSSRRTLTTPREDSTWCTCLSSTRTARRGQWWRAHRWWCKFPSPTSACHLT